mmetsp:Transcript_52046/g.111398  ORF Transcript_52046/g.111398 Transcript_52046/m.111398 type:complete len:225 (+) Transcript_52046:330-1004(+)
MPRVTSSCSRYGSPAKGGGPTAGVAPSIPARARAESVLCTLSVFSQDGAMLLVQRFEGEDFALDLRPWLARPSFGRRGTAGSISDGVVSVGAAAMRVHAEAATLALGRPRPAGRGGRAVGAAAGTPEGVGTGVISLLLPQRGGRRPFCEMGRIASILASRNASLRASLARGDEAATKAPVAGESSSGVDGLWMRTSGLLARLRLPAEEWRPPLDFGVAGPLGAW